MTNLVDERLTRPLVEALRGHVDALTQDVADQRGGRSHDEHWRLASARPCAVAWVFLSVLVAWAQDHALIDPWLRTDGEKARALAGASGPDWLTAAFVSLAAHPATACLIDPRYSELAEGRPRDQVCENLLTWWSDDAPSLAYDVDAGPGSLSGWLPGDLLQALSDERTQGFALVQTPWWVADGILDSTLVAAARTSRDVTLRSIDPTCGTGHFLVRTIGYLWELYTTGSLRCRQMRLPGVTGWARVPPAEAIKRIVAGVHGCDIDPLTVAVARLRYVVAVGDLMHRAHLIGGTLRLDHVPRFQPPIAVGDSLLAGKVSKSEYARVHPRLAAIDNAGYEEH